jgi:hypothetical protein
MAAYCLLLGSPTIGWYSGIVVLDVVRGERVLDLLMFNTMHVRNFVEECRRYDSWRHFYGMFYLYCADKAFTHNCITTCTQQAQTAVQHLYIIGKHIFAT